jgi:hypothetical protein
LKDVGKLLEPSLTLIDLHLPEGKGRMRVQREGKEEEGCGSGKEAD